MFLGNMCGIHSPNPTSIQFNIAISLPLSSSHSHRRKSQHHMGPWVMQTACASLGHSMRPFLLPNIQISISRKEFTPTSSARNCPANCDPLSTVRGQNSSDLLNYKIFVTDGFHQKDLLTKGSTLLPEVPRVLGVLPVH